MTWFPFISYRHDQKHFHRHLHAFIFRYHSHVGLHIWVPNFTKSVQFKKIPFYYLATCRITWQEKGKDVCTQNITCVYTSLSRQHNTYGYTKLSHNGAAPQYECEICRRQHTPSDWLVSWIRHVQTKSIIQQGCTETCKLLHTSTPLTHTHSK